MSAYRMTVVFSEWEAENKNTFRYYSSEQRGIRYNASFFSWKIWASHSKQELECPPPYDTCHL